MQTQTLSTPARRIRTDVIPLLSLTATVLSAACIEQPLPSGPEQVEVDAVVAISLQPQNPVLLPGQTIRFSALLLNDEGEQVSGEVEWESDDLRIQSDGLYTAPDAPGRRKVKVKHRGSERDVTDSTVVQVADPDDQPAATSLSVSPDEAVVTPGEQFDFRATLYADDGSPVAGEVTWSATGGSIDGTGRYVAGTDAGTFEVVATFNDLADTASVHIEAAPDDPDPPEDPVPPANEAPTASFTVTCTDLDCEFDASGSSDSDGSIVLYSWSFGAEGVTASHTFPAAGVYTVELTVTDDQGATATHGKTLTVEAEPEPGPDPDYDVAIEPGQSIQSAVNANPEGTVFLIRAGVHHQQSVTPKSGQVFQGEPGALLDGDNATAHAFRSGSDNVTIRGLEITGYAPDVQYGVIEADWDAGIGWIVEDSEIHHNGGGGIKIGHDMVVRNNHLHHNGQFGLLGWGHRALIEGNEISYNNVDGHDPLWAGGAMKIFFSEDVIFRNNHVHHNFGFGIWFDHQNSNVLIEGNLVEDNDYAGIFQEINYSGVIRGNTVLNNGLGASGSYTTAGIAVSESMDTEVTGNTLAGNRHGIMAVQQDRGGPPWVVENLWVHDNDVTQQSGGSGLRDIIGDGQIYNRNNRFDFNTYRVSGNGTPFWRNSQVTTAEWLATGQDQNSEIVQ